MVDVVVVAIARYPLKIDTWLIIATGEIIAYELLSSVIGHESY